MAVATMTKGGPRYAILPADAVTDPRVVGPDLKVLALLGRHIDRKGWCVRSQGRMADELSMAKKTLQRSLSRLVDAGYVEISHETRRDGGQAANRYRVILDEDARADQLDLFATDAVRSSRAAGKEVRRDAPPTSSVSPPRRHLSDHPPATPGCRPQEERPLRETSPSNSRAELRSARDVPANDIEQVPTRTVGEIGMSGAIVDLGRRLRGVAGEGINAAHPGLLVLSEPLGWLASGCDLELDVLPTIAGLCARPRASPIRSWSYFADAVREARDRRLSAVSAVPASRSATTNIVPFQKGGSNGPTDTASTGRFAGAFARRRRLFAGDFDRGEEDQD